MRGCSSRGSSTARTTCHRSVFSKTASSGASNQPHEASSASEHYHPATAERESAHVSAHVRGSTAASCCVCSPSATGITFSLIGSGLDEGAVLDQHLGHARR